MGQKGMEELCHGQDGKTVHKTAWNGKGCAQECVGLCQWGRRGQVVPGAMWGCGPTGTVDRAQSCAHKGCARAQLSDVWAEPVCTMAGMGLPVPLPSRCEG